MSSGDPLPRRLGLIRLVRQLPRSPLGERWIGLHESRGVNTLVCRLDLGRDHVERRRVMGALAEASAVRHPHLLEIEASCCDHGRVWAVSPYPGNQHGLVTLGDLIESKGRMDPSEGERTLDQILSAISAAHAGGLTHGPISIDGLLVDRHGTIKAEMYGVGGLIEGPALPADERRREEIRSVVLLGHRLLMGFGADGDSPAPRQLIRKIGRGWEAWFGRGLDPAGGFESAAQALSALPGRASEQVTETAEPQVTIRRARAVFGRVRRASEGRG